jgi:hypothetical protein
MQIKTISMRLSYMLLTLALGFLARAQMPTNVNRDSVKKDQSKPELRTLFTLKKGNGLESWGISAGPVVQFGQLGTQQGFNFAIHVNNQWEIGAGVLGNMRRGENQNRSTPLKPKQLFSGFQIAYTPKSNSLIHISFPLMIGAIHVEDPDFQAYKGINRTNNPQMGAPGPRFMHRDSDDVRGMFRRGPAAIGIQPGLSLELNVFKYAKLFGAVNYRFAAGKNSHADMKGVSGQIGLKLGLFDRPFKSKTSPQK